MTIMDAPPEPTPTIPFLKNNELHKAARCGDAEKIKSLLQTDEYKDGAKVKDPKSNGSLPLHVAAKNGHVECVLILLEVYKDGATVQNDYGRLPIHQAALKNALSVDRKYAVMESRYYSDCINILLEAYNDGASIKDNSGMLALHYASFNGLIQGVHTLLHAYREGAKVKSESGYIPLHAAVKQDGNEECVNALIDVYQDGAKIKARDGAIPLHNAAVQSVEYVNALIDVYPDGCREMDDSRFLPLHLAASCGETDSVKVLLQEYRDGAKLRSGNQLLAIDHAHIKQSKLDEDIISILFDAYPQGVFMKDTSREPYMSTFDCIFDEGFDEDSSEEEMTALTHLLVKAEYSNLFETVI